jgi:hypothetical protein
MAHPQVVSESTIKTNEVPTTTLELLTGTGKGVARPGGIFTKEDLINIKLYVKKGMSLPLLPAQVQDYVGYTSSGIAGLEPAEIGDLFGQVQRHAIGWDGVQQKVVGQGIELKEFSTKWVASGEGLLETFNDWPFMKKIKETLSGASTTKLEDITYGREDPEVALTLGQTLEQMRQDVEDQRVKTTVVKNAVTNYRVVLVGGKLTDGTETPGLEPQVARKYKTMVDNKLAETIKADEDSLKEKQGRIEQLKKDYDKFVGLAFTGAAGGVIGLIITGGIFGAKAEVARKERNELINEVRALLEKVTGAKNLQKALQNISIDFSDIGTRMLDAETALGHLDYMWASILSQIEGSQKEFQKVNNGMAMTTFISTFKSVVTPFTRVGDLAGNLMNVIDEALVEYKKKYEPHAV